VAAAVWAAVHMSKSRDQRIVANLDTVKILAMRAGTAASRSVPQEGDLD
jgi:hypothetical protein